MIELYGDSVTGLIRKQNQDRFACGTFSDGAGWAMVCDGMGGPNGGEIAAESAVDLMKRLWTERYQKTFSAIELKEMMEAAAQEANEQVLSSARKNPDLTGMGTTMVCCIWRREELFVLHAGDSRLYLLEGGKLTQLTHDHSMVQALVDQGQITAEEAQKHPERNLITKALGVGKQLSPEFSKLPMPKQATLLLCSDGLTSECTDEQIEACLNTHTALEKAVKGCIEAALEQGGHDNITVVLMRRNRKQ